MKLGIFEWMLPGYCQQILAKGVDFTLVWYIYKVLLKMTYTYRRNMSTILGDNISLYKIQMPLDINL